jgi:RNA polymerase sigma-70 factor, ECF subfamily
MATTAAVIEVAQDHQRSSGSNDRRIEAILGRYRSSFYRKAYQCLGNAADAEDAVQNALLSACQHLDQFRGEAQLSTWLMAIVVNSARMLLRKRLRQVHVSLDVGDREDESPSFLELIPYNGPNPEDEFRGSELRERVTELMPHLSPKLRKAFELRALSGMTIRETAQILGVPTGTAKAQLARARTKLRSLVRKSRRAQPPRPQVCRRAQPKDFLKLP